MLFQYTDNPEMEFKLWNLCVAAETVNMIVFFRETALRIS